MRASCWLGDPECDGQGQWVKSQVRFIRSNHKSNPQVESQVESQINCIREMRQMERDCECDQGRESKGNIRLDAHGQFVDLANHCPTPATPSHSQ
jgi:hypothetical protein